MTIVAAYIMDVYQPGIDKLATPEMRKITDRLDHLFVSYEQCDSENPGSLACAGFAAAAGGGRAHARCAWRESADRHHQLRPAISRDAQETSAGVQLSAVAANLLPLDVQVSRLSRSRGLSEHRQMFFQMLRRAKIVDQLSLHADDGMELARALTR